MSSTDGRWEQITCDEFEDEHARHPEWVIVASGSGFPGGPRVNTMIWGGKDGSEHIKTIRYPGGDSAFNDYKPCEHYLAGGAR